MFKVAIKNYQIISSAQLEFDEGLTIITGSSNSGKTAIFRAIESALFNKAGNDFIQQGKDATMVGVQSNGHTVLWKKTKDSGEYKVDKQAFNKIGRGPLVEAMKALNIEEIAVGDDKIRVNFLHQMQYPFLLDKNPSQLFNFLSLSDDTDKLVDIFKQMRSDLRETNSEIDIGTGTIDSLKQVIARDEAVLNKYSNIDDIANEVFSYEYDVNWVSALEGKINDVSSLESKVEALNGGIESMSHVETLSRGVLEIESLVEYVDSLFTKLSSLESISSSLSSLENSISSLEQSVSKVSINIDFDALLLLEQQTKNLSSALASLTSMESSLTSLSSQITSLSDAYSTLQQELLSFKVCPLCGQPLTTHSHSE